ncbi:hypothetical protein HanPSC8_Chr16g0709351 [Helianthus annuus]|nr:hypothetical protein HanPSC8_Chr16g0709351 [Helianthus annuus]
MIKLTTLKNDDDSLTRNKLGGSLMRERVKRIKKERKSVVRMRGTFWMPEDDQAQ